MTKILIYFLGKQITNGEKEGHCVICLDLILEGFFHGVCFYQILYIL